MRNICTFFEKYSQNYFKKGILSYVIVDPMVFVLCNITNNLFNFTSILEESSYRKGKIKID